ncbi:hypothetical protein AAFC00_000529 [Neodothiora populina]|uniref:NAD(P)-binding protein n=1 Tax=Neodothiora populina TaxID=2781224 RepID=A0ABR3PD77_9PEZI
MLSLSTVIQLIGASSILISAYRLCAFAKIYLIPSTLSRYHHGKPGSTWALVTGATDGIGHGFASHLCASGFNVLLHGRNPSKLLAVQQSLETLYPAVQIKTVAADAFVYANESDLKRIVDAVKSLPGTLTVLINNVGGVPLSPAYAPFVESSASTIDDLMNLNARFPTQLTRALLPLLMSNTNRDTDGGPSSLIMNINSGTAVTGNMPFIATYSAAKAFGLIFTTCLHAEMNALASTSSSTSSSPPVEVLGIIVGNTTTARNPKNVAGVTCSADYLASQALARVGCGQIHAWAWWRHGVLAWVMANCMPEALVRWMVARELTERMGQEREEMKKAT